MRGSKKISERIFILNNAEKIFFVSRWTMNKFFEGLPYKTKSNCDVLYPSIKKPPRLNKKKQKKIIFSGKLNSSKGYDIFGTAIIKILNKYNDWSSVVAGNEPREKFNFSHKNLKIYNWLEHKQILNLYDKSSISVVPSKWEEPFGRTAMESAAYGCATITSSRGGLVETFNNKLILKKLNSREIYKMLNKLINNRSLLKKHQYENFNNVIHKIEDLVIYLDTIKKNLLDKNINILRNKGPKILHISNFNEKNNQRLFNISIASKISNGLTRNKNDVINFSYRNYLSQKFFPKLDQDILEVSSNYKPDLVILGHNNILDRNSLLSLKEKKIKTCLWYEDHVAYYGPSWQSNLNLIEKNNDLIDKYFITTHPDALKTKISKNKLNFLPIPVDENIETLNIFKYKHRYKDLFFALSHGVNFGGLRKKSNDEREIFLEKLLKKDKYIKFHILGINNDAPKWNYDLYKEMLICKMSLNLSRGKPLKYASSNRIASYMGNGILTFIDERVKYSDFFNENEMLFYKNENDLCDKILNLKDDIDKINRISKNGKRKYFKIFNNLVVSDFITNKSLGTNSKHKYVWDK
ncbi:glycosyltransferase, partial [Candidatus Pelagibacter sp.]|nr:glycosyltransferase [Candidatus Pelagibacter sp.]